MNGTCRLFFGFLLLMLPAAGTVSAGALPALYPVIFTAESVFSFPAVSEGTEVEHEFPIRNNGSAQLLLNSVKTG